MRTRRSKFPCAHAGFLLGLVLLIGCSGGDVGPTVRVTGKVTLDGEPFSEGSIWFISPSRGYGPSAQLNEDGSYALKIEDARVGEKYGVYIGPITQNEEKLSDEADGPVAPVPPSPPPVPLKYQRAETSELTASIDNGNDATFDFDLKSE